MSRVTPPVNKAFGQFVRSISSTTKSPRPSTTLLNTNDYLPRRLQDLKEECSRRQLAVSGSKAELVERLAAHDHISRSHSTLSAPHRPHLSTLRTIPLMQGFRNSAPVSAAHDSSTIDFMFFPEPPAPAPLNPFSRLRVPLLPDNYSPDRSQGTGQEAETLDGPILSQEILVVAAHPEQVLPSAMTEVVGNEGADGVDNVRVGMAEESEGESEQGEFGRLWGGLVDDIFGRGSAGKPAL